MSELDSRVGVLEREQARHGEKLSQLTADVHAARGDVAGVASDIKQLLAREQSKPAALTGTTVAATCGSLVAVAYVVWWLIGASPAVVALQGRLDKLDDPQIGRVTRIENRIDKLDGWAPSIRAAR